VAIIPPSICICPTPGQIFCHDCSSQKAALPSSATPVRVCNRCFDVLEATRKQAGKQGPALVGGWAQ